MPQFHATLNPERSHQHWSQHIQQIHGPHVALFLTADVDSVPKPYWEVYWYPEKRCIELKRTTSRTRVDKIASSCPSHKKMFLAAEDRQASGWTVMPAVPLLYMLLPSLPALLL